MARRNPSPSVLNPISFLSARTVAAGLCAVSTLIVFTAAQRVALSSSKSTCATAAILCGTVRLIPTKSSLGKNSNAERNSLGRM